MGTAVMLPARNCLAGLSAAARRSFLTDIDWDHATVLLMVTHAHAFAAQATEHATLEQRWSLPGRSCAPFAGECTGVFAKPTLVGLKTLPIDVALVHARHDELPIGSCHLDDLDAAVGHVPRARAAIREGAGIPRIVQNLQNTGVPRRRPQQVSLVGPGT